MPGGDPAVAGGITVSHLSRHDAHLILAAIRILAHRDGRPPRPADVAELLDWPEAVVRLHAVALQDLGAAILVESAFDTHLEIGDHLKVEELVAATATEMSVDLAAFDRKKAEEADRMAHLFDDGEFERKRREKLDRMGADLDSFKGRKPRDPFQK
jgi:hypothetical protein